MQTDTADIGNSAWSPAEKRRAHILRELRGLQIFYVGMGNLFLLIAFTTTMSGYMTRPMSPEDWTPVAHLTLDEWNADIRLSILRLPISWILPIFTNIYHFYFSFRTDHRYTRTLGALFAMAIDVLACLARFPIWGPRAAANIEGARKNDFLLYIIFTSTIMFITIDVLWKLGLIAILRILPTSWRKPNRYEPTTLDRLLKFPSISYELTQLTSLSHSKNAPKKASDFQRRRFELSERITRRRKYLPVVETTQEGPRLHPRFRHWYRAPDSYDTFTTTYIALTALVAAGEIVHQVFHPCSQPRYSCALRLLNPLPLIIWIVVVVFLVKRRVHIYGKLLGPITIADLLFASWVLIMALLMHGGFGSFISGYTRDRSFPALVRDFIVIVGFSSGSAVGFFTVFRRRFQKLVEVLDNI